MKPIYTSALCVLFLLLSVPNILRAQQSGLHFDGTDDAIIIGNAAPMQMNSGTLEAWIKTNNAGSSWRAIAVKALAYGLFLYDNELVVYDWTLGSGLGNIYTGVNLADGNWHHVAVAFNSGLTNGSSVYVDGALVRTYTQNIFAQTEVFAIGQSGNSGPYQSFQGTIDEVRIWNVRRTATEIADNRNCDVAQHTNLLAYYRFNEGTASGTNTGISTAIDYSGNGYCGTMINFAKTGSTSNFVTGAIGTCNTINTTLGAITGTLSVNRGANTTLGNSIAGGTWSSSNTTIATVNVSTGVVTGLFGGTCNITYAAYCNTVAATVTVNANAGMYFDGANDYVNIGTVLTTNSSYTKEAWVYAKSHTGGNIISGGSHPFWIATGFLRSEQGTSIQDPNPFPLNSWVHVAATYDSATTTLKIYKNGLLVGSTASAASYAIQTMNIGDYPVVHGNCFNGYIDDVRIWKTARTITQIQNDMNCDVAQTANLVAYYRFDEGVPAGTNTGIAKAIDYSGNSNCGTFTNMALSGSVSNYAYGAINSCNTITIPSSAPITGTLVTTRGQSTDLDNANAGGSWSSSNTAVATVNSSTGVVTGFAAGTATISYILYCNTISTAVVTVTALAGLHFDGSNDFVNIGTPIPANSSYTKEAWVYADNLIGARNIMSTNGSPFWISDGTLAAGQNGNFALVTSTGFPANTWVHVAVTYDQATTTLKLYKNGVLVATNASSGSFAGGQTWIGSYLSGSIFLGKIDEARIWNVARTQSQIQADMNCDVAPSSNLIAYYRFNEGTIGGTNTSMTNVIDYSGNNNCGVLTNFALTGGTSNFVTGTVSSCSTISVTPPGVISGTLSVCVGLTTDLDNPVAGGQWSSSNTAVATIDATSGVVTAIAPGTTNITYRLYCVSVTGVVTVNPNANAGSISGPSAVCVDASASLSTSGTGGVWSSSNTAKATVNGSGVTTGIESGLATISYVVVNSCGTDTATAAMTINPIPSAISGGLTVCPGSLTVLTNTPGGGTWSSPDATVSVNATNGKVTGVSPGTALISYTIPGGCAATATVTVTPPPGSITGTLAVCPGGNATLVPDVTGGTWSSSSPTKATINESTGEVAAISSGVAIITYTTGSGCYTTVPFTVNAVPAAITGALTICPGTTSDLNSTTTGGVWTSSNTAIATVNSSTGLVTSVAGSGTSIIQYTVGGLCPRTVTVTIAASSPNVGTPTICLGQATAVTPLSNATPGGLWTSSNPARIEVSPSTGVMNGLSIGTAVITYSLNAGCFSTTIVSVTAAVNAITGVTNICPGNTTTLSCPTAGGTWSSSNSSVASTGTGAVVTGISAGIATITYQVTAGCYKTTNVSVYGAIADITGIDTVCAGANTTLSSGPAGGTWSSSNTARATINVTSGVATGISAGTTTITYRLGSSGCMTTKVITINPSVPVITGTANVCPGATTTLLNAVADGTWSSSNTSKATIDASSGIVTGIAQGTSVVTYMASPTCYRTTIQSVNAAPAAISGPASVCTDNTITLSSSGTGIWSSTNTAAATISSAGILRGIAAGVTTISYIITGTGCSNAVDISVNPVPANITGTLTACVGATTTVASAPGGGIWSSSNPIKATVDASSGVVSALQAGTANITYTLATGCYKKAIVTLSSVPALINGVDSVCVGLTTALSTTTGGGSWSSSNPAAATVNPTSGLVRGVDAGVSTISYRFTSGCASVRQITVNGLPDAITGGTNICIGAPQTLASSGGGVWSSSNTLKATVNAGSGQVSGISAGSANITYTLPTGCYRKTLVNINTSPAPISGAASVNFGATTTLTCTPGGGSWSSFDADIASVIATNGIVTGVNEGTTTIKYELANGCYSTTEISVTTPAGRQHVAGTEKNTSRLFSITPNPTSGVLNIATSETGMFAVFTMDGKMVSQTPIAGTTTQVVLPSDLATGMYLCKFTTGNGLTELARIVLSH